MQQQFETLLVTVEELAKWNKTGELVLQPNFKDEMCGATKQDPI